jgi:hypothetical protein
MIRRDSSADRTSLTPFFFLAGPSAGGVSLNAMRLAS